MKGYYTSTLLLIRYTILSKMHLKNEMTCSIKPNSITVLTHFKIICLYIIYKEKARPQFRRSITKGVNAHARSCACKRSSPLARILAAGGA